MLAVSRCATIVVITCVMSIFGVLPAASAATTIGLLPPTSTHIRCGVQGTPDIGVYAAQGGTSAYSIPTAGVITSWSGAQSNTAMTPGMSALVVFGQVNSTTAALKANSDLATIAATGDTGDRRYTRSTRISVGAGDTIGVAGTERVLCGVAASDLPAALGTSSYWKEQDGLLALPAPGQSLTFGGLTSDVVPAVQARLEADFDLDGFGDETQDSCPLDVQINAGPCSTDIVASGALVPTSMRVGELTVLTATLRNAGTQPSSSPRLTVTLPATVTLVSADTACAGTGPVTCTLPTLAAGASANFGITLRGVASGSGPIGLTAGQSNPEAAPSNDTASVALTVLPDADLAVMAKVAPKLAKRGARATVTITTRNASGVAVPAAQLVVTLPKQVVLKVKPKTCTGTRTLTCALGALAGGASATIKIQVAGTTTASHPIKAVVSHGGTDRPAANNTSVARLLVGCVVPRVIGLRYVAARMFIARAGCTIGSVSGGSIGANTTVLRQSVRAGKLVAPRAKIGVVLSRR